MKSKPTLVIVDMQTGFDAANHPDVVAANCKLIRRQRRRKLPIVVLEFFGCEKTHPDLLKALKGYNKVAFAEKRKCNGSSEVDYRCKKHKYGTDEFHVTGVNMGACVDETVYGLRALYPESKIVLYYEAVNCQYCTVDEDPVWLKEMVDNLALEVEGAALYLKAA